MTQRFSQRLKTYRKTMGYRQETLARIWDYSLETISAWEREKRQPSGQEIPRIARFMGISVDELVKSIEAQRDFSIYDPPSMPSSADNSDDAIRQNELLRVYHSRRAFRRDYSYAALFEQAREILAVGIRLDGIVRYFPAEKVIDLLTKKHCSITLCFLDPDSRYCVAREQEERYEQGQLRDLIRSNIKRIQTTRASIPSEYASRLRVYTYDMPCRFNICLLDDTFLTAQFYMHERGEDTPLYVYQRRERHGLFEYHAAAAHHVLEHAHVVA